MEKYSTRDFDKDFPNNDACLEFLFHQRWPDGVVCQKCQKVTSHYRISGRPCYSCEFCGSHVYPMAGTILQVHGSLISVSGSRPLHTWQLHVAVSPHAS